ncbi:MAG: acyl--CoA ligase [Sandaracinaceae bacterium]|nr:acyl--CoA ligase [Sandaracinaceae bacterium]
MPADATPTPDLAAIEAHLTGPGQPFELEQTTILGEQVTNFKNRPRSLRDVLQRSATFGQADYMVWQDGRRYTYAEHLTLVATLAANLASIHGIKPGDRVAILAANCPEWVLSFWAVTSLGAVAVGLNAWWTADEILYGIADCQPSLLIADEKRLARLSAEQLAGLPCWVLPIDADFEAALREAPLTPAALPTTPITEEMPAVMLYTSGTTGRPKAAVHTHGNLGSLLMVSFFHGARLMALKPPAPDATPNCILVTSPLFHVFGAALRGGHGAGRRGQDGVDHGALRAAAGAGAHSGREGHGLGLHGHHAAPRGEPPAGAEVRLEQPAHDGGRRVAHSGPAARAGAHAGAAGARDHGRGLWAHRGLRLQHAQPGARAARAPHVGGPAGAHGGARDPRRRRAAPAPG